MFASITFAATIQIGATRTYTTIQAGIDAAEDGDVVEVDAGEYSATAVEITKSNLTLKGVGGRPHLTYSGNIPNDQGILLVELATVHDLVVENLEISGATGVSGNAAAIRFEGVNLTVRDCYLHHSQNGILELNGSRSGSVVLVERTELAFNGVPGSVYQHNVYIGADVQSFTLRYSYSHHAKTGHLVKSRAQENYIIANRLMDELPVLDNGTTVQSSAVIDLPQGGRAFIIGNLLHKGTNTQNKSAAIWYGGENGNNAPHELYVVNNTYVSATASSATAMILAKQGGIIFAANNLALGDGVTILSFQPAEPALGRVFTLADNLVDDPLDKLALFNGAVTVIAGVSYKAPSNRTTADAKLLDRAGFDWHLATGSVAIDTGIDPGTGEGVDLTPAFQYVHRANAEARPEVGPLDVGAYEYVNTGGGPSGQHAPIGQALPAGASDGPSVAAATPSAAPPTAAPAAPVTPATPAAPTNGATITTASDVTAAGSCAAADADLWVVGGLVLLWLLRRSEHSSRARRIQ